jgi:hypothetical protein
MDVWKCQGETHYIVQLAYANKKAMRHHFTPISVGIIKKAENSSVSEDMGKWQPLYISFENSWHLKWLNTM